MEQKENRCRCLPKLLERSHNWLKSNLKEHFFPLCLKKICFFLTLYCIKVLVSYPNHLIDMAQFQSYQNDDFLNLSKFSSKETYEYINFLLKYWTKIECFLMFIKLLRYCTITLFRMQQKSKNLNSISEIISTHFDHTFEWCRDLKISANIVKCQP